jgi:hypothetical protein
MVLTTKKSISSVVNNEELEDLSYGPGIVSKLRCRYMSLTLNQSSIKKRPSITVLRRTTSLTNLIDDDSNNCQNKDSERNEIVKEQKKIKNSMVFPFQNNIKTPDSETSITSKQYIFDNERPPTDVVKSKLRIFEPNYIADAKIRKNDTNHSQSKVLNSMNNVTDRKRTIEYCSTNTAQKSEMLNGVVSTDSNNTKTSDSQNILSHSKNAQDNCTESKTETLHCQIKTVYEMQEPLKIKHSVEHMKYNGSQNEMLERIKSHLISPFANTAHISSAASNSFNNQSIIFNFSRRKDIPTYLPQDEFLFLHTDNAKETEDDKEQPQYEFLNANIVVKGKSCIKVFNKDKRVRKLTYK